jgi:hypothetical protein
MSGDDANETMAARFGALKATIEADPKGWAAMMMSKIREEPLIALATMAIAGSILPSTTVAIMVKALVDRSRAAAVS